MTNVQSDASPGSSYRGSFAGRGGLSLSGGRAAHDVSVGDHRVQWNGRPRVLNASGLVDETAFANWLIGRVRSEGVGCLRGVGGEWWLSVYDSSRRTLILATDRLGAMPLFYQVGELRCHFADRLQAMVEGGGAAVDQQALIQYLTLRHIAGQRQLVRDVLRLLPGQFLRLSDDGRGGTLSEISSYYSISNGGKRCTDTFAVEGIEQGIGTEISTGWEYHAGTSGQKIGMLFSSGLDSSYLLGHLSGEQRRALVLATFGFAQQKSDDLDAARTALRSFGEGLQWEPVVLDPRHTLRAMDAIIRDTGFPVDHPNFLARHAAYANLAARGAGTVIAGEGADTLLGGSWYVSISKVLLCRRIRKGLLIPRHILNLLALVMPDRSAQIGLVAERDWQKVCLMAKAYVPLEWLREALQPLGGISMWNYPYHEATLGTGGERGALAAIYKLGLLANMSSELIAEQAMASACGTYQWNPYLDGEFLDAATAWPPKPKTKGWEAKRLLYAAARSRVPLAVLERKKCGSPAPLVEWFRDEKALGGLLEDIAASRSFCRGFLERKHVVGVVDRFRAGPNAADAEILWVLANLERWAGTMQGGAPA